ncbi:MAG: dihydrolipoamide dehydrogenase, partial [Candidatus Pelagibacter sp.]|nr:dihydrolipoamide dehydrogenase [Candidatus Pelagibacter sp.]
MKKFTFLILFTTLIVEAQVVSPQASPFSTLSQVVGLTDIKIEYSRPSMKGRVIMGNLIPYGELWRTGANANTRISFSDPVTIAGVKIPAGKYALYTRPGKDMWEVFFYNKSDNWALPEIWDVNEIAVVSESPSINIKESVESFSIEVEDITYDSAYLTISWENTKVKTLIEVPTKEKTLKSIDQTLS